MWVISWISFFGGILFLVALMVLHVVRRIVVWWRGCLTPGTSLVLPSNWGSAVASRVTSLGVQVGRVPLNTTRRTTFASSNLQVSLLLVCPVRLVVLIVTIGRHHVGRHGGVP